MSNRCIRCGRQLVGSHDNKVAVPIASREIGALYATECLESGVMTIRKAVFVVGARRNK